MADPVGPAVGHLAGAVRAGVLRDLQWAGYVQVILFMVLLLAGYVYVWRKGVLDWGNEKPGLGTRDEGFAQTNGTRS